MNLRIPRLLTLLFAACILINSLPAQQDIEPTYYEDYIKKEKGKFGIWDKSTKEWILNPYYDRITGIAFTKNSYDAANSSFLKLWNGDTFALVRVSENGSYKKDFEFWLFNISAVAIPDLKFEFGSKKWCNFIFYQQNGKWGWMAKKVDVTVNGYFQSKTEITIPPIFDNPPTVVGFREVYYEATSNYLLQVELDGKRGLYSLAGQEMVKPGEYKSFEVPLSVDFGKDIFIKTEGINGLYGYNLNGAEVSPAYVSIQPIKNETLSKNLYECVLPNSTIEYREGINRYTADEIKSLENAEIQRQQDLIAEAARKKELAEQEAKDKLMKSCNLDFFNDMARAVSMNDVDMVKEVAQRTLSITGYSTRLDKFVNMHNSDPQRNGETCTVHSSSEKFGHHPHPFQIVVFTDSGKNTVEIYRSLNGEEITLFRETMKQAEAENKGWSFYGIDGIWEMWHNDNVFVWFPEGDDGYGNLLIFNKPD